MTDAEHKSPFKLTKYTPYLALTDSYAVSIVRIFLYNWVDYTGIALYFQV